MSFDDPDDPGNGPEHHTGKFCVEGCGRPAGTAWGPHWCHPCNVERLRRIDKSLSEILAVMAGRKVEVRR